MADSKETPAKTHPAPPPAPPPPPAKAPLGDAGASTDAGVQSLLARRQTHVLNGDTAGVAAVDEALAGFGVTV